MRASLSARGMRSLTYSLDALYPGFYLWLGSFSLRLGGVRADQNYKYRVATRAGLGLVLPRLVEWTTHKGQFAWETDNE